jgi:glycosyltransferase involved in cell wall biosynthesis
MIKIYDCSNSPESIHGRDYGPKENDIIRGLKEYAKIFDCRFVNKYNMADIIITNDIFPNEIKNMNIPKIKRMDGIYWQNEKLFKNDMLNESAEIADHVIFISEFSKKSLEVLYPNIKLKDFSVILNSADNKIFKPSPKNRLEFVSSLVANCTNWNRKEKRFDSLMQFARLIPEKIYLIGHCEMDTPDNVIKLGYIDNYEKINEALNGADVFVNLSYRDAAPKVVCQAVSCGLPVLYADSGGVSEILDYGVPILDEKEIFFSDDVYELDPIEILKSYNILKSNYLLYKGNVKRNYLATIKNYYKIIEQYGNREKILGEE